MIINNRRFLLLRNFAILLRIIIFLLRSIFKNIIYISSYLQYNVNSNLEYNVITAYNIMSAHVYKSNISSNLQSNIYIYIIHLLYDAPSIVTTMHRREQTIIYN
jgi:hypothetical protein